MADTFRKRLQHAWNAFMNRDPTENPYINFQELGFGSSHRPDRMRFTRGNERTIVTSVCNRIALDVAAMRVQHVRLDKDDRFTEVIDDGLNYCLTTEANIDQTSRAFLQDVVQSMLDEGCVAIVPVDTDYSDPTDSERFDVLTMRTGKIVQWYPSDVRVEVYNERIGQKKEIILPKKCTAIVENPLYAVMNEPNSTMQRLKRTLSHMDVTNAQNSSGKLDIIVQLPYAIKTETKKRQAENRRKDLEDQLANSKYGIGYMDSTEHVTQLNRPAENNYLTQAQYLTDLLYSQLGITTSVMDGTADEKTMLNYYNRTVEPILAAITDEMKRKFLSKTARTQKQSILYFRDPFKLVPLNELAESADKFTRNEIMTSNEFRQAVGMKPSSDPSADELRNKNLSESKAEIAAKTNPKSIENMNENMEEIQNE